MMQSRIIAIIIFTIMSASSARALTDAQKNVMHLHGVWQWSISNCSDIHRGKRYWHSLREAGQFDRVRRITENEDGKWYESGWRFMQKNSFKFGIANTCDFAMAKWPAILWRKKK